ncbi:hypothetical protein Syun_031039 [Stephania yunnanensis]|uniref:Uncharacterized protein n=1 Tax=Stephania yunnanensis TaxID=152371 RepID=A0AAP0HB76_9MAGN
MAEAQARSKSGGREREVMAAEPEREVIAAGVSVSFRSLILGDLLWSLIVNFDLKIVVDDVHFCNKIM